jgi:tetratricopeptide (TPR) repeat protein
VPATSAKQAYSKQEVCRILGISGRQLTSWQRQGFLRAGDSFAFSDLGAMRTLIELRKKRVPARRIASALDAIRKLSGFERPLSELKIVCDGRTITVRLGGQKMAASGQLFLDFDAGGTPEVKTLAPKPHVESQGERAARHAQAEHWFQRGLELEETGAAEEAMGAYRRAIELNPKASGALVNLGTMLYHARKFREAEKHYTQAILADPHYALAHYNLGNLFDERGELERARECYLAALRLDPSYADAHYNLALLLEKTGELLKATHHWKLYLKLDASSSWAEVARRQLEKLRQVTIVRGG